MSIIQELRTKCDDCEPCDKCVVLMERAAQEIEQLREQLLEQTKSLCTHCGQFFPAGKEGLADFRKHISRCNAHPLSGMAAEIERLQSILTRIASVEGCECDLFEGHVCMLCRVRAMAEEARVTE